MDISTKYNFEIISKLNSEGVNSNLYIIKDLQLDKILILKRIDKNKIKDKEKYFEESKKISKLDHPNIINIESTTYDDKYVYMTMPYYKNGSLQKMIELKNLSLREIIKYSLDFMSAIYHIHSQSIVHCDIKPSNILIDDKENAIITDFGTSLYLNKHGNSKLKNVYYKHIAPEQCTNSTITKKIDIYQIGTTLYRMCNGDYEYNRQAKKYKELNSLKIACANGRFPVRKKYMPHIPRDMIKIVEKCINVNPYERYCSVLDIMNDIAKIESNLDWNYIKESDDRFIWLFSDKYNYEQIVLYKIKQGWVVVDLDGKETIVDTKSKGYRVVRSIIKVYEQEKNLTFKSDQSKAKKYY